MSPSSDSYDWHVAGNGAIGMTMAWHIHNAGQRACLLSRSKQPNPMQLSYRFNDEKGVTWLCPTQNRPEGGTSITRLVVASKAFSVGEILETWAPALAENARVYFMQNGRDFIPQGALLPSHRANFIVNSGIAAYRLDANSVVQTAMKPIHVGDAEGQARPEPEVAADLDLLAKAGFKCEWASDIDQHRWAKLTVNAIINPLTVIYDCRNGELLKNPEAIELMNAMHKEASALFKDIGVPYGEEYLRELTENILHATRENISSMLQDYRNKSSQNELPYIMGPLIREAKARGVDVLRHCEVEARTNARFKAMATPG